ncbi:MAG: hypothetical protein M3P48_06695, partial [Actinomycetota bacterium]|nr:hypothetical protein [Actinomycetota bacterium]
MSGNFVSWLRALDVDGLAGLLAARPDALAAPLPRSIEDLANRLSSPASVQAALRQLSCPALALSELLQARGGVVARDDLPRRVATHDPADAAAVELVLHELSSRGLVLDDGRQVSLVGPMRNAWTNPLGLGEGVRATLRDLPSEWGEQVRKTLGLRKGGSPGKTAALVAEHFTPARVRELLADAPHDAAALLARVVDEGGRVRAPSGSVYTVTPTPWRQPSAYTWLLDRALLLPLDFDALGVPREVSLALRGDDWAVHLPLQRPEIPTAPADPAMVERESAARAGALVATATELLEQLAKQPAPALKSGGLGVREIRRLTKELASEERIVVLATVLAGAAGLVVEQGGVVLPTPAYDEWRAAEPAQRLAVLLDAWWNCPTAVTDHVDQNDKALPPLAHAFPDPLGAELRRGLLSALAGLPAGRGAVDLAETLHAATWDRPMSYPPPGLQFDRLGKAAWWELEQLGLSASGAVTALGRAVLAGTPEGVLTCARELLPAAVGVVVFQADLTAVVPGHPSTEVAALLDEAADREGR